MADYHAFSPLGSPNPGDVPVAQADGSVAWGPQSAGGIPLSTVLFANVGTTVPLANQNGFIGTPFASLQDAINTNPAGGTIVLAPGDYGTGLALATNAQFLGLAAQGSSLPVVMGDPADPTQFTVDGSAWFENVTTNVQGANGAVIEFLNCQGGAAFTATGTFHARLSTLSEVSGAISFEAFKCLCAVVSADDAEFQQCSFTGNVTVVGELRIIGATHFDPGLTLTAADLVIDEDSLRRAVFAGVTFAITNPPTGFSGANLTWGRNSGLVVGNFPNAGIGRQNYTGANVGSESQAQVFAPRRGVLCFLVANSGANLKFTVRVNGADTALTVTVNNTTVRDTTHFVEVQAGDLISLQAQDGGDPAASGSCLASATFV